MSAAASTIAATWPTECHFIPCSVQLPRNASLVHGRSNPRNTQSLVKNKSATPVTWPDSRAQDGLRRSGGFHLRRSRPRRNWYDVRNDPTPCERLDDGDDPILRDRLDDRDDPILRDRLDDRDGPVLCDRRNDRDGHIRGNAGGPRRGRPDDDETRDSIFAAGIADHDEIGLRQQLLGYLGVASLECPADLFIAERGSEPFELDPLVGKQPGHHFATRNIADVEIDECAIGTDDETTVLNTGEPDCGVN